MLRKIDHLVLCVHDLDAAVAAYQELGFTVTPRAVHPFGTGNALIQLDGMYIELLSVVDPEKIPETDLESGFSFAGYNRDYLKQREGMSMLALQSDDAHAARQYFIDGGAASPEVFDFERLGKTPNGDAVELGFSLAFATHPLMRHAVCFVCQHHHPAEHFYFPEYQTHENGAYKIDKVLVSHWASDVVGEFYGEVGISGLIDTSEADELALRSGGEEHHFPRDGFAGFEIVVDDLNKVATKAAEFGGFEKNGHVILPPSRFFGTLIVFRDDQNAQ
ncbi:VOC family protein [Thalassospira sp. MA62]|nr:VOC family protein [Thalassospira sp. MA62]